MSKKKLIDSADIIVDLYINGTYKIIKDTTGNFKSRDERIFGIRDHKKLAPLKGFMEEYPKARKLIDETHSIVNGILHWPFHFWCKLLGHPQLFLKWTRMISSRNESISFRSCRLCGNIYEEDALTTLAIIEREINLKEQNGSNSEELS